MIFLYLGPEISLHFCIQMMDFRIEMVHFRFKMPGSDSKCCNCHSVRWSIDHAARPQQNKCDCEACEAAAGERKHIMILSWENHDSLFEKRVIFYSRRCKGMWIRRNHSNHISRQTVWMKIMNFLSKPMNFAFKPMSFVLKSSNSSLKSLRFGCYSSVFKRWLPRTWFQPGYFRIYSQCRQTSAFDYAHTVHDPVNHDFDQESRGKCVNDCLYPHWLYQALAERCEATCESHSANCISVLWRGWDL